MENKRILQILAWIAGGLILLNIINELAGRPFWHITRFINVNAEANFATWFSSLMLAIAACYAFACSRVANIARVEQRLWQGLTCALLVMSCDETAMIHEHVGMFADKHFINLPSLKFSWVVVFAPVVLVALIFFVRALNKYIRPSQRAARLLAAGALVYLTGAFLFESTLMFLHVEDKMWLLRAETIGEEGCEMAGVILIIAGLMSHIQFLRNGSQTAAALTS